MSTISSCTVGSLIFVDTSAWYASEVPDDVNHDAADEFRRELARGSHGTLVTTDYVLDETLTLLRMRRDAATALAFAKKILESRSIQILWIGRATFEEAMEIMQDHGEMRWSFTDCVSFAVMEELGIREAFTFDINFAQAGFTVLPTPR